MKGKIIKILKSHSYHHTEGVWGKSQFKYLAEIAFECCADEIMLALDQSQFTADEAEEHINQEVEKRISVRTALISEGYYPKEFTEWVSGTGWQYHMKFKIWTLGMTADKMVKATTDELYEVWKENER